jgi:F-type H+-transporting ATPase subunit b
VASYLAEVVGFVLLIAATYRYAWPLLRKLMDNQAESIRSSLASADAGLESSQQMLADARAALEAAHSDAMAIIEQAHETSAQLLAEGEGRGRDQYDRLVTSAAAEAEFERQRAREEVARQVGAIVMAATERVVAAEIDASLQRVFIGETIDAAEAMA